MEGAESGARGAAREAGKAEVKEIFAGVADGRWDEVDTSGIESAGRLHGRSGRPPKMVTDRGQ